MSSSPYARIGIHTSADRQGFYRPGHILEASTFPRPRIPVSSKPTHQAASESLASPEYLEHITTPPRRINRPNRRFLIDTPRNRLASPDRPRHWPRPNPRPDPSPLKDTGTQAKASVTCSTLEVCTDTKSVTVTINGSSSRKRPAESTEIELVASVNGISDLSAPLIIEREGQTFFEEDAVERPQEVQPMRWVGIFSFWARMITSFYSAVSGLTGRLGQWINPKSYGVAESRSYLSDNQVINKRVKLSREEDGQIRWIDRQTLSDLIDTYRAFAKSINQVWECMSSHHSRQDMNRILEPLRHALADNESDRATLIRGGSHDLCELFQLQFRRAFQTLDSIYEIGVIIKIRDQNETVPPVLDYHLSPQHVEMMNTIKTFLSAPTMLTVCKDVLRTANRSHVEISDIFLDQIILDLEAITHNLPAPSYVISQEFRDKLQETFPRPQRTDLETNLLLPGAFPDSEEPQVKFEPKPKSTLLQQAELSPIKLPVPEYVPPVITRPTYRKSDFIRADMLERSIAEITPRQYRDRFYHESEAHHTLEKTFVTELVPKVPLTATDVTTIKSILKNKRKHPSRCTPKRLGIRRPPKSVRFTDCTVSPQPRTRVGLDVPRILNDEVGLAQDNGNGSVQTATIEPEDTHPQDEDYLPWSILKSRHSKDLGLGQKEVEKKVRIDADARIAELFALPSLKPLRISDDSHAGIVIQKEQAALKAEEEARQKAEAERLAAEEKARRELEERLAASGGLRLPSREFVSSLSAEWQMRARDTLRAAASTIIATTGEGVDLRRHDFAKVVPATEWLNDEIVNGSLNWLDQAVNSAAGIKDVKKSTRKCLSMSSFFFKRLQEQGVTRTQRTLRRFGVEKNNILDVDTILMPICEHSHWTLLVIRPSKRTVAHMDSLNPRGNATNTNLAIAWMKDVLEDKFDAAEWQVMRYEAPRQTNGHDCGVHTITNGMCLALGLSPVDCYAADDMPMQRIRIACMLLNGGFKGDFDLRVY